MPFSFVWAKDAIQTYRDRTELWPLLVKIATSKAANLAKHQRAQKRGSGRVNNEAAGSDVESALGGLAQLPTKEPTPELVAQIAERCDQLFHALDDDQLRQVAQLKLEGFTNIEIAQKLNMVTRTVDRRLRLIRGRWQKLMPE